MPYSLSAPAPFHLPRVVKTHGWFQLVPFHWSEGRQSLFLAIRFRDGGRLVVRLGGGTSAAGKRVPIRIHTGGRKLSPRRLEELKRGIRHIFNLDLDLSEFYRLCRTHPVLSRAAAKGMGRFMRAPSMFEDLVKSICGTNCTWKQAVQMINRLGALEDPVRVGEEPPEGVSLGLFPGPERILEAGEAYLLSVVRLGYRAPYIIDLCRRVAADDPDLVRLGAGGLERDEMERILLTIQGIGRVTARYILALHGHYDRIAVDSLVLSHTAAHHFGGRRPSPAEVERLYDSFGKWRYLAYWMEFILQDGWRPEPS